MRDPAFTADVHGEGIGETIPRRYLAWYLFELCRLGLWQTQLTTWRPEIDPRNQARPEAAGLLLDLKDLYTEEEDRAGLGMVAMLEGSLAPWFRGEARLDYDRLRVLVGYDRALPPPGIPHPRYEGRESSPVRLIPQVALGWAK